MTETTDKEGGLKKNCKIAKQRRLEAATINGRTSVQDYLLLLVLGDLHLVVGCLEPDPEHGGEAGHALQLRHVHPQLVRQREAAAAGLLHRPRQATRPRPVGPQLRQQLRPVLLQQRRRALHPAPIRGEDWVT